MDLSRVVEVESLADFPGEVRKALLLRSLTRPVVAVLLVGYGLAIVAYCGLSRPGQWWPMLLVGLAIWLGVVGLFVILSWIRIDRNVSAITRARGRYGIEVGEVDMTIITPLAKTEVSFDAYRGVSQTERVVMLLHKGSLMVVPLPRELFSTELLALVKERIAGVSR